MKKKIIIILVLLLIFLTDFKAMAGIFFPYFILGYNNSLAFNSSGAWTVPAGVTTVMVELWGGGAGGEPGSGSAGVWDPVEAEWYYDNGSGGSGGSGGRYVKATVNVTPGEPLTINVGAGGGFPSGAGGNSELKRGLTALVTSASAANVYYLNGSYGRGESPLSCDSGVGSSDGGAGGFAFQSMGTVNDPGQGGYGGSYSCGYGGGTSSGSGGLAGRVVIWY